jgi:hypothetical protein
VLQQGVVKVLSSQVGVSSSGLDGKDTSLDGKKRNIESTTTQVENEDHLLLLGLLVETVSNGSGSRLVDDSENLETGNSTSVLGSETLRVVEVGGDAMGSEKKS